MAGRVPERLPGRHGQRATSQSCPALDPYHFTCSWWGLVWVSLVFFGGERRQITNVDDGGNVLTSRLDSRRAKVIAAVALCIVGGLWLLLLIGIIAGIEGGTTSAAPTYAPYGGETPVPTPTPIPVERVDAGEILSNYNTNEAAADAQWRGRWLLVTVRGIDDIDNEGRVRKFGRSLRWQHLPRLREHQ